MRGQYSDPRSRAVWVPFEFDHGYASANTSLAAAAASAAPLKAELDLLPTLGPPDMAATGGRLLLFGIFAIDESAVMVDHLLAHYISDLGVEVSTDDVPYKDRLP